MSRLSVSPIERTIVAGNVWYPRTQQSVLKATYLGEKRTRHALAAIHTMALRVGMFKKTRSHHPKDEIVVSAVPKIRAIGLKKTQSCPRVIGVPILFNLSLLCCHFEGRFIARWRHQVNSQFPKRLFNRHSGSQRRQGSEKSFREVDARLATEFGCWGTRTPGGRQPLTR